MNRDNPFIIGLTGIGGSGKTTVAHKLKEHLEYLWPSKKVGVFALGDPVYEVAKILAHDPDIGEEKDRPYNSKYFPSAWTKRDVLISVAEGIRQSSPRLFITHCLRKIQEAHVDIAIIHDVRKGIEMDECHSVVLLEEQMGSSNRDNLERDSAEAHAVGVADWNTPMQELTRIIFEAQWEQHDE